MTDRQDPGSKYLTYPVFVRQTNPEWGIVLRYLLLRSGVDAKRLNGGRCDAHVPFWLFPNWCPMRDDIPLIAFGLAVPMRDSDLRCMAGTANH